MLLHIPAVLVGMLVGLSSVLTFIAASALLGHWHVRDFYLFYWLGWLVYGYKDTRP